MNFAWVGRVIREQSGFFWIELEAAVAADVILAETVKDEPILEIPLEAVEASQRPQFPVYRCRLRGRLMEMASASDIAAIGDRVVITITDAISIPPEGAIERVLPRHSVISRAVRTEGSRGAGAAERESVIIANADQALFVFAAAQPDPSPRMLDRFLVVGQKAGIEHLVIVVNKIDLAEKMEAPDVIRKRFHLYERIGYPVLYTSALENQGVDDLRAMLTGKISVFTGPSGVGKTSLLNRVQPGLGRSVKAVSGYAQEGVHTTRDSELVKLATGGYLADTPGIRTLSIWDVEPAELDAYFVEFIPYIAQCRFADCTHRDEPGCAVRAAVESGAISGTRYKSYRVLREELEATYLVY